jgi:5'-nucleotidase
MATAEATVTYSSGRASSVPGQASSPPDIRLIHYNDVYHIDPSSSEPVGGAARFVSMCKEYREGERFKGQPDVVTLFSGDVFNPSLESSVTKGSSGHLVPFT